MEFSELLGRNRYKTH